MTRALAAVVVVAVLLGATVGAELALQRVPREDPLGRRLLYLPSAEMLSLGSLGNPGLMADLLYLWSIQYYSTYRPHERFLYLETIFNLITDLDPLFHDAYRIGALIMQIPTVDEEQHKQSVIRLFDKGLDNLPADVRLAEAAGWDMFVRYRDKREGIRYFRHAVSIPGAPHRLRRFLAAWSEDEQGWPIDSAIAYWQEVRSEAETDYDRAVCDRQIYRLVAARDVERLDPILEDWRLMHGRCPGSWDEVVGAGFIPDPPLDYFGRAYRILPESCTAMGEDEVRFD